MGGMGSLYLRCGLCKESIVLIPPYQLKWALGYVRGELGPSIIDSEDTGLENRIVARG